MREIWWFEKGGEAVNVSGEAVRGLARSRAEFHSRLRKFPPESRQLRRLNGVKRKAKLSRLDFRRSPRVWSASLPVPSGEGARAPFP